MKLFDSPGEGNTDECLELASQAAKDIDEIIVATKSGDTGLKAMEKFPGRKIIAVTCHAGFKEPFKVGMALETRQKLESSGVKIVTAGHALSGIERSFRLKYQGLYPLEMAADILRMFGQGTKVCVEIALMAADAGELSGSQSCASAEPGPARTPR
jgi:hypothetical protein